MRATVALSDFEAKLRGFGHELSPEAERPPRTRPLTTPAELADAVNRARECLAGLRAAVDELVRFKAELRRSDAHGGRGLTADARPVSQLAAVAASERALARILELNGLRAARGL